MLRLMWEFFKTGLFAVGGGMATIPFLQDMGEKCGYFTSEELLDMIAVSESTPGAIGINMATYAGNKAYGPLGGILATLSLIAGPIIIILIIARMMSKFKNSKLVADAFSTLRPATAGLILGAMASVLVITLFDLDLFRQSGNIIDIIRPLPLVLFAIFLGIMFKFKKLHPLWIIGAGALCGVIFAL
ncbi:chromate transporter [uncultured Anaerococcus sp.]|uniref:chromate transporter n=1 Tax=uncultured Anaerococcus sp. TaxID=293428 RepID=UPI002612BFA3|nr:chromate transporter [uncultured Anaerococcus sp.]